MLRLCNQPEFMSIYLCWAHADLVKFSMSENLSGAPSGMAGATVKMSDKPAQIQFSNISAAKAVVDAVRTSIGQKGMDKMI